MQCNQAIALGHTTSDDGKGIQSIVIVIHLAIVMIHHCYGEMVNPFQEREPLHTIANHTLTLDPWNLVS
jgi:hypothetical protein